MSTVSNFFFAGGTMEPRRPSYLSRQADDELHDAMAAGEFCYVLTSRQMGKSTLFSRAALRLRQEGFRVCIIDLQGIGTNVTPQQWFDGMLERLGEDFDIEDDIDTFRDNNSNLGSMQMWLEVLRRVVLARIPEHIIIVIDEIDLVRSIEFDTDELFLGIRELHNSRANTPELNRLSFCLLGVASPGDLIENKDVTPFNIGRRIELRDFSAGEVRPLADGFDTGLSREEAGAVVARIHHWAGGQPFLMQKLCQQAVAVGTRTAADVDRLVADAFLTQRARETEPHFIFIGDRLSAERKRDPAAFERLMEMYRSILRGRAVADSETSMEVSRLKLSGIVKGEAGRLVPKSPIHRALFGKEWVREQVPRNWRRIALRLSAAAALAVLIACGPAAAILWMKNKDASRALIAAKADRTAAMKDKVAAEKKLKGANEAMLQANAQIIVSDEKAKRNESKTTALIRGTVYSEWSKGRRFVSAALLAAHASDPAGEFQLPPGALELDPKHKTLTDERNDDPQSPGGWSPERMNTTWLSPVATVGGKEAPEIIEMHPWPGSPGTLLVGKETGRERRFSLLVMPWISAMPEAEGDRAATDDRLPYEELGRIAGSVTTCPRRALVALSHRGESERLLICRADDFRAFAETVSTFADAGRTPTAGQVLAVVDLVKPPPDKTPAAKPAKPQNGSHEGQRPVLEDIAAAQAAVSALRLSQDGRWLAVGHEDGTVTLLEDETPVTAKDANPAFKLRWHKDVAPKHSERIAQLEFLHGGSLVQACSENETVTIRTADGSEASTNQFQRPMTVAPDGMHELVSKAGGEAGLFLTLSATEYGTYETEKNENTGNRNVDPGANLSSATFSPDNQWFAAGLRDGSIGLGHAGRLVETIPGFSHKVTAVAFSPDGASLLAASGNILRVWRLLDRAEPVIPDKDRDKPGAIEAVARRLQVKIEGIAPVRAAPEPDSAAPTTLSFDQTRFEILAAVAEWRERANRAFAQSPFPPEPDALLTYCEKVRKLGADERARWRLDSECKAAELIARCCQFDSAPDEAAVNEIEKLPLSQRWFILSLHHQRWAATMEKPAPKLAARILLAYAACEEVRLQSRIPKDPQGKREYGKLATGWHPVLDKAVAAMIRAYEAGARGERSFKYLKTLMSAPAAGIIVGSIAQCNAIEVKLKTSSSFSNDIERRAYLENFARYRELGGSGNFAIAYNAVIAAMAVEKPDYPAIAKLIQDGEVEATDDTERGRFLNRRAQLIDEESNSAPEKRSEILRLSAEATRLTPGNDYVWSSRGGRVRAIGKDGQPEKPAVAAFMDDITGQLAKLDESESTLRGQLLVQQMQNYLVLKETAKAMEEGTKALESARDILKIYRSIWEVVTPPDDGVRQWKRGKLDDAMAHILKENISVRWDADALSIRQSHAKDLRERGQHVESALGLAALAATRGIEDSKVGWCLTELAETLGTLGLLREAESLFREGIKNDTTTWAKDQHTRTLERMGRLSEALKQYGARIPAEPNKVADAAMLSHYATALARAGRIDEGLSALDRQIKNANEDHSVLASALFTKAHLLRARAGNGTAPEDEQSARESMKTAVAHLQTNRTANANALVLARAARFLGDYEEAGKQMEFHRKLWPSDEPDTLLEEARLTATRAPGDPAARELSWGKIAQAVAFGFYDAFDFLSFPATEPLSALPAFDKFLTLLRVDAPAGLAERDRKLADFFDQRTPQAADAATRLRARAEALHKQPFVLDLTRLTGNGTR